jgi:hypothetical protein
VTDSLCNSGAFSNPNAVREFPFNFFRMQRYCFKAFQRGPTKYLFTKENIISSNKNAFSD